jgi:hypothetical protein
MALGRAGPFFAGASIGFIVCGFGSPTPGYLDNDGFGSGHGYLDRGGSVALGELRGVGREFAVRLSKNVGPVSQPKRFRRTAIDCGACLVIGRRWRKLRAFVRIQQAAPPSGFIL